jgi:hypothetical protein
MAERRVKPRSHSEQRFETAKQMAFAQREGDNNALQAKTVRLRALRLATEAAGNPPATGAALDD